jgi:hypothetical protein
VTTCPIPATAAHQVMQVSSPGEGGMWLRVADPTADYTPPTLASAENPPSPPSPPSGVE